MASTPYCHPGQNAIISGIIASFLSPHWYHCLPTLPLVVCSTLRSQRDPVKEAWSWHSSAQVRPLPWLPSPSGKNLTSLQWSPDPTPSPPPPPIPYPLGLIYYPPLCSTHLWAHWLPQICQTHLVSAPLLDPIPAPSFLPVILHGLYLPLIQVFPQPSISPVAFPDHFI